MANDVSEYLKLCEGINGQNHKLMWKLVSFLALDAEAQKALIGPTEEWFVKEDAQINPGANYLCGVILLIEELGGGYHFNRFAPSEVDRMSELVDDLAWGRLEFRWSFETLEKDKRWLELRKLARVILERTGLSISPPKHPIWLPDKMEIGWRNYKEFGELPKRKNRRVN